MKKTVFFSFVALAVFIVAYSCKNQDAVTSNNQEARNVISQDSLIKRGQYLVTAMACNDCHSPKKMGAHGPEPDEALALSGHPANQPLPDFDASTAKNYALFTMDQTAAIGPWGVSFAANITSDSTGIGNWTEQQFFKAMREGKYMGLDSNRMLLPPMPWQNFRLLNDEDLKAIFVYLKSTKPVHNVVPQAIPPTEIAKLVK
jgi:hypothetical protein